MAARPRRAPERRNREHGRSGGGVCRCALLLAVVVAAARAGPPAHAQDVRDLVPIRGRVDTLARALVEADVVVGLTVGVVRRDEHIVAGYGRVQRDGEAAPDGDTLYEIGSISKTFTGLLLADLARNKRVHLRDSVRRYLDPQRRLPGADLPPITLVELATHTSGLARLPGNLAPANPADPYADYTAQRLASYLASNGLHLPSAERFAYSNLGTGLLGHTLAQRMGTTYEELLAERILRPLGMRDTGLSWTPEQRARVAPGHSAGHVPVPNWNFDVLAGAGGLRSSVHDMLRYVAANAAPDDSGLGRSIRLAHQPQRPTNRPPQSIGLGWIVEPGSAGFLWHNGATGGYQSWISVNPAQGTGVVILCNTTTDLVDALGHRLQVLADGGKVEPLAIRRAVHVPAETLVRYVGNYALGPRKVMAITREGDQIFAQETGGARHRLYAASATLFFFRTQPGEVEFVPSAEGPCPRFILHARGRRHSYVRTDRGLNDVARDPDPIELPPGELDDFVGTYEFDEGRELAITREGTQLYARYTGRAATLIRPHAKLEFHYPGTEARLEFERNRRGKVVRVTYREGETVLSAKRID